VYLLEELLGLSPRSRREDLHVAGTKRDRLGPRLAAELQDL
jgi:hypothetical protein